MKALLAVVIMLVAGCTTYVPVEQPVEQPAPKSAYVQELEKFKAEVADSKRKYPDRDKSADTLLKCDQLGFARGSDGHRLCMLRGMDRYVDHMTPPISERYLQRDDEISVKIPKPAAPPLYAPKPSPLEPLRTPDGGYIYPSYVPPAVNLDK